MFVLMQTGEQCQGRVASLSLSNPMWSFMCGPMEILYAYAMHIARKDIYKCIAHSRAEDCTYRLEFLEHLLSTTEQNEIFEQTCVRMEY